MVAIYCYLETTKKEYIINGENGLMKNTAWPVNGRGNYLKIIKRADGDYVAILYYNRTNHYIKLILT
jgi:hypothetical protein